MTERINGNFDTPKVIESSATKGQQPNTTPSGFIPMTEQEKQSFEKSIAERERQVTELENQKKNIKDPVIPERPKPDGEKVITIVYGDTASQLAEKYHCSMNDLEKANPGVNLRSLVAGKKLNMPFVSDAKWKPYGDAVSAKEKADSQRFEIQEKIRKLKVEITRDKKILKAESIIGEIQAGKRAEHFEKYYNISIDRRTGNLVLKFKKEIVLRDVKSDFKLKDGVLREANGEDKIAGFKKPVVLIGDYNYDDYTAPAEESLIVPTEEATPRTKAWYQIF